MTARPIRRALAYAWALPCTALGLVVVALAAVTGARARIVEGALEAHGGALPALLRHAVPIHGGASAMTLGHVVVGRDLNALARTRSHERAHVRQAERWGPLFLPAYLVASLVATARGRHYYRDNRFEQEAVAIAASGNDSAA